MDTSIAPNLSFIVFVEIGNSLQGVKIAVSLFIALSTLNIYFTV